MDVFIKSLLHFANIMTRDILHICWVQTEEGLLLKVLLFYLLPQTCFKGGNTHIEYEALKGKESLQEKKTSCDSKLCSYNFLYTVMSLRHHRFLRYKVQVWRFASSSNTGHHALFSTVQVVYFIILFVIGRFYMHCIATTATTVKQEYHNLTFCHVTYL